MMTLKTLVLKTLQPLVLLLNVLVVVLLGRESMAVLQVSFADAVLISGAMKEMPSC